MRITDGIQDIELINLFAKHHIIAHSYNKCFTDTIREQGLILGNSTIHTPVITSKLQQMYQLFKNK